MRNVQNQMNKYLIFIATVVVGTIISYSPAQKESKQVPVQQQNQVQQAIVETDTSATNLSIPATVATKAASNEPAVINTATTPPELNPPHGQPFHRCDIPVGSPLSAAAPAKSVSAQPAPAINRTGMSPTLENAARLNNPQANNPTAPAVATGTAPKLNPPHGQPFHRCDIAVGSPLPVK